MKISFNFLVKRLISKRPLPYFAKLEWASEEGFCPKPSVRNSQHNRHIPLINMLCFKGFFIELIFGVSNYPLGN
jgi:hypothetical protein